MAKPRLGVEKIRCYGFASVDTYNELPTTLWAVRQDNLGDVDEDAGVASTLADTRFTCRRPIALNKVPKPAWLLVDKDDEAYAIVSVVNDTFRPRTHIIIRARRSQ